MHRVRPLQVETLEAKDERQIGEQEAVQTIMLKGTASSGSPRAVEKTQDRPAHAPHRGAALERVTATWTHVRYCKSRKIKELEYVY